MAVADGYSLMVAPLPAGPHKVQFGGATPLNLFSQDVTYNLVVSNP